MRINGTAVADVSLINLKQFGDERGFFSEVYSRRILAAAAIDHDWVQDNHALSKEVRTLRGLHFQRPPHAQAKLVRVSRGAIFDVVVDLRKGSPSFGRWTSAVISSAAWNAILIPKGLAHGYLTLEDDTEVQYKVDDYHAPDCEAGIVWNDPELAIEWPLNGASPLLSVRDRELPKLAGIDSPFVYGELNP